MDVLSECITEQNFDIFYLCLYCIMINRNYKIKIIKYVLFSLVSFLILSNTDSLCDGYTDSSNIMVLCMILAILFSIIDMLFPVCYIK